MDRFMFKMWLFQLLVVWQGRSHSAFVNFTVVICKIYKTLKGLSEILVDNGSQMFSTKPEKSSPYMVCTMFKIMEAEHFTFFLE